MGKKEWDQTWAYRWWLFENRVYNKHWDKRGIKAWAMMNFVPLTLCFVIVVGTPLFLGGWKDLWEWFAK